MSEAAGRGGTRSWRQAIGDLDAGRLIGLGCLLVAIGFNAFVLFPELVSRTPAVNDHVFHLLNLERAADALRHGQDPTDVWLPSVGQGYPVFHYYQHLPYLIPAMLVAVGLDPVAVLNTTGYILLCAFPVAMYWSVRRFGFSNLAAGTSALVAPVLSTDGLFGLDFASYVWAGHGLYTQAWGMVFLPLAVAQSHHAISQGRGYVGAVLLVGATTLSHLAYGYIAIGSLVVMALVVPRRDALWRRLQRGAIVGGASLLATSYFLVPLFLDRAYLNRSVWESAYKFDSFGAPTVLGWLFTGQLLDFGRLPVISILAGIGLAVSIWRWRDVRYRIPALIFGIWLLAYFGRPTWGFLLDLTPLSGDFFLHRLIGGVHLGAIYLAGIGLAAPMGWAIKRRRVPQLLAVTALGLLLMLPVFKDRIDYLHFNDRLMEETDAAVAAERLDIDGLLTELRSRPPGRVYAGLAGQWGRNYLVGGVPMYALLAADGYETLRLYHSWSLAADVAATFDERRPDEYDLFDIRYVVAPAERQLPDFVEPIGEFGRHRLYEVATTGFFDLVSSSVAFEGDRQAFFPAAAGWLNTTQVAAKEHPSVFLGDAPRDLDLTVLPLDSAGGYLAATRFPPQPDLGSVISESAEGDRYRATVDATTDALVLLKATFHPNLRATVDGEDTEARMLLPGYVGVPVPAGEHEVVVEYRPGELRHVLMLLGIVGVAGLGWLERRRPRWVRLSGHLRRRPAAVLARGGAWFARVSAAAMPLRRASKGTGWESDLPHDKLQEEPTPAGSVRAGSIGVARYGSRAAFGWLPYVGGVLAAALVAGLPLLRLQWMSGHDTLAYMPRNVEFFQSLAAGTWFPRWAPDLAFGHGEPTFNFNPPLVYYLTSAFHALGLDFVTASDLAMFALLPLAGIGIYLLACEFFGRQGGLVSAVAYLFAPYLLSRLYVSHALADYSAFAFMPFAFWGLYRYAMDGRYRFLIIGSLAGTLILLGSSMAAFMTFPALALLVLWLWFGHRRWEILARGAWCVALAVGMGAFFWLPSLAETGFVHIDRRIDRIPYVDHFLDWWQLVVSPWGYGLSVPGPNDGMSFAIGPLYLAAAVGALLLRRRIRQVSPAAGSLITFFLILLGLSAFMSTWTARPIWDALPALQQLQFPFRFLQLVALATAFLVGFPLLLLRGRRPLVLYGSTLALIGGLLFFGLPHATPEGHLALTDADFTPEKIAGNGVPATGREFEPIWVEEFPTTPAVAPTLTFVGGSGEVTGSDSTPTSQVFVVNVEENALVRSSTFYFPGWMLYVDDGSRAVAPSRPAGLMEFYLEPGRHVLLLTFEDTPVRTWSGVVSLVGAILLIVSSVGSRLRWPQT
jgi:uncharacterized membrane protein